MVGNRWPGSTRRIILSELLKFGKGYGVTENNIGLVNMGFTSKKKISFEYLKF